MATRKFDAGLPTSIDGVSSVFLCVAFVLIKDRYHDALSDLSNRVVHMIEESFGMTVGTFDRFFKSTPGNGGIHIPPQHRIKLLKYPKVGPETDGQGVGPHKDSSGWLTFLYQVGQEHGLEVLSKDGSWVPAPPLEGTFVVNFGNAFEAATEGAVKATVHRVKAPKNNDRYSVPFFMGLPLDLTVPHIRQCFSREVKELRRTESPSEAEAAISTYLDPRWRTLGESQLRKWIRSHEDVGRKWYGDKVVEYYLL
jgi:isopenicillin N synthase-like dioxygenase